LTSVVASVGALGAAAVVVVVVGVATHLVLLRAELVRAARKAAASPWGLVMGVATRLARRLARVPRRDLVLGAACVVGLVVRLVWVTVATRSGAPGGDAAEYLRTASDLADGVLPRFNGRPSAFWSPGYPALLVPLELVSRGTGVASTAYLATLLNAAAGASTVLSTAYLAARWIGPGSRNLAAWLMALAPGQVYWTSTQHTESVHTAALLGVFVLITWAVHRWPDGAERSRWMLLVGLLVGALVLIRTPGAVSFVLALLVVQAIDRSWRRALKATGLVVLGSLVLLVPWTVRNGVQVGFWSPTSSNNATATCLGHHPDAGASFDLTTMTQGMAEDCFRHSPYDDASEGFAPLAFEWEYGGVDEPRWYREASAKGLEHALDDPWREVGLTWDKLVVAYRDDADALPGAASFVEPDWAGRATEPLDLVATWWVWGVLAFAALAMVLSSACRRATPIWVPPLLVTLLIVGGTSYPHYRHPAMPFLVVLASGGLVALADRLRPAPPSVSPPAAAPTRTEPGATTIAP
jgi:hypothetical protein